MTKTKIIGLVFGLLVIAGLVFAMFYLSSLEDMPEEPTPETEIDNTHNNERNVIYSCNVSDIEYLQVSNKYGEYRVRRTPEGTVYIEGREGAPLLPYSSAGLYESVKSISCNLSIENGTADLGAYGLDLPQATVTVLLKDGTETVFHIGNSEPTATGYYICMDGSSDVYLVNSFYAERYLSNFMSLYDTAISEYFSYADFESVSIKRADGEEIFIRTTTGEEETAIQFITGYAMDKPFYFSADSDTVDIIIDTLGSLKADKVVCDRVDQEILTQYGFDNAATVTLKANVDTTSPTLETGLENPFYGATMDGSPYPITLTYRIGGISDRDRYVMYNDAPVIYSVDVDVLGFVDFPLYQYCQKLVSIEYITNLESLRLEFDGKDYLFEITDPDAGEDMTVVCNDEYLDQELFRSFYKTIISVTHNGIEPRPQTEPVMKITYGLIEGEDIVLEFLPCEDSDRKVFISINGGGQFVCYRTKVDKIKNDLEKLFNGEEIIS